MYQIALDFTDTDTLGARQGVLDAVKVGRVWYSTKRAVGDYVEGRRVGFYCVKL